MTWGELRSGKDRVLSNADRTSAEQAIAELLWNALDAEATEVRVTVEANELGAATRVVVNDNGTGIPYKDSTDLFLTEGDSWKRDRRFSSTIQRPLHGHLGRGRLLSYAIADTVTWETTFIGLDDKTQRYLIEGSRDRPAGYEIGDPSHSSGATGTRVNLELRDTQKAARVGDEGFDLRVLGWVAESLASVDCLITWNGNELSPERVVDSRTDVELPPLDTAVLRGHPKPSLVVVEWNAKVDSRRLHLCDDSGFTISDVTPAVSPPAPFAWSAYLQWEGFRDPDLMGIADLAAPEFKHSELLQTVSAALGAHLARRLDEEKGHIVRQWIDEGVYPFRGDANSHTDQLERDLFDVVAVIASPSIPKRNAGQTRLTLRLLRELLRSAPGRVRQALSAVIDLNASDLESLERLLKRTELGAVVRSAAKVADRLDFLEGLAGLLYSDDTQKSFREIDQLHPMLVSEPWVFGDEWNECLSEHGLTRVVRSVVAKHNKDAVVAVEPVTLPDGKRGRVDLLFHKIVPESEQHRHLVVELKRPGKLTMGHYGQVANYATSITQHSEVARTATRWDFWLVGTDLDNTLDNERYGSDPRTGLAKDYGTHRIWVITWGELIQSLRMKYENYRSELNLRPTTSTGFEYLRRAHNEYLPDTARDNTDTSTMSSCD